MDGIYKHVTRQSKGKQLFVGQLKTLESAKALSQFFNQALLRAVTSSKSGLVLSVFRQNYSTFDHVCISQICNNSNF